ncbi:MAG: hypothetical protein ONB31_12620 [candidate division KSB1 bacterium]|nr:hypothetical protein [candidate division KSB1 bacterium]MDZ7334181.1 hypothetical protein [candidate division KSB1 bacterium]MDZ7357312.1 hypothetical protein [candidate division KSB1 bacterium]MDZ7400874.1 hypothetical protein [candidate division KSB1 bacterium]
MSKGAVLMLVCLILAYCQSNQQPRQAPEQGLQKVYYKNPEEIQRLRSAGAEIIVQEPNYVVIRTDKRVQNFGFKPQPIQETDLVQRLVEILLKDSSDLQTVVNSGIDLWQVAGDTVIARAYDIYIERLREAGFVVHIIAQKASSMEGNFR